MMRNDLALRLASNGLAVQPVDTRTRKAIGPATADTKEVRKIWSGRNSPFINLVGANEECQFLIEDNMPDLKDVNSAVRPIIEKVLLDQQKWFEDDDLSGMPELVSMDGLWDENLPEFQWLMQGFLPKDEVILMPGWCGIGKSRVVLSMCMHVASGKPWFGHQVEQGKVIYLTAEEKMIDVKRRLQPIAREMGESLGRKALSNLFVGDFRGRFLPLVTGDKWGTEETGVAERISEAVGEADLVVFDTLTRFHSVNENDNAAMAQVMTALEAVRANTNATVLVIHHTAKGNKGASRGASSIEASARGVISVDKVEKPSDLGLPAGHYLKVHVTKLNGAIDDAEVLLESVPDGFVLVDLQKVKRSDLVNFWLEWKNEGEPNFSKRTQPWNSQFQPKRVKELIDEGISGGAIIKAGNQQSTFAPNYNPVVNDGKD